MIERNDIAAKGADKGTERKRRSLTRFQFDDFDSSQLPCVYITSLKRGTGREGE